MYQKGDKILYPLYGAGIIENLEDKDIDGEIQTYYVLNIPVGSLKIMISAAKAESHNVRPILPADEILVVLAQTLELQVEMPDNWTLRYKENMDRIKSGDLPQVALVYHSLLLRERERGLSTAEKKLMTTAKQIILSELILALDIDRVEAEEILDNTLSE